MKNIFTDYLSNNDNFNIQFCITHGDFDTSNILIDPQTLELTGVIDFETCRIYDPACDLLFYDEGLQFLNAILSIYNYDIGEPLKLRMKFFYCRTCIEYLEWGIEHARPAMIEEGFRLLSKNMDLFPK